MVRSGRKWRRSRRTKTEIKATASKAKTSEPIEDLMMGDPAPWKIDESLEAWWPLAVNQCWRYSKGVMLLAEPRIGAMVWTGLVFLRSDRALKP